MFITKTMNESTSLEVPNMSLDQYMIESTCDAYEDLLSFNEALAHFDIKEQELIHTESVELDAFREDAMDKAKQFLKDLVAKIKTKWNQFINFILKKVVLLNSKIADKLDESAKIIKASSLEKAIDNKDVKIKYFSKSSKLSDCVDDIVDFMDTSFNTIDDEKDLDNFKPADLFKELVGEAKEARPVSGKEFVATLNEFRSTDSIFTNSVKERFNMSIEKATRVGSGDEKEAARRITLINIKGQQIVRVAYSALVSLFNTCLSVLIKAANEYRKELNKNKSDEK